MNNKDTKIRIANNYQSLYYNTASNDPAADAAFKAGVQQGFKEYGLALSDGLDDHEKMQMLFNGVARIQDELGGPLSDREGYMALKQSMQDFAAGKPDFEDKLFENFEHRYDNEPADFLEVYDRDITHTRWDEKNVSEAALVSEAAEIPDTPQRHGQAMAYDNKVPQSVTPRKEYEVASKAPERQTVSEQPKYAAPAVEDDGPEL